MDNAPLEIVKDDHTDVPVTPLQMDILQRTEADVVTAQKDFLAAERVRNAVVATALAGAGIPGARLLGFNSAANTIRVKLDAQP